MNCLKKKINELKLEKGTDTDTNQQKIDELLKEKEESVNEINQPRKIQLRKQIRELEQKIKNQKGVVDPETFDDESHKQNHKQNDELTQLRNELETLQKSRQPQQWS